MYRGLRGLDKKLEKYLDFDGGYYIELGANDGLRQSNSFYFEKYRGWHGLLIEPDRSNYEKCRENRAAHNAIYCAACVSFDYPHKQVQLYYSDLMTTPVGLESDINDACEHAHKGERFLARDNPVRLIEAEARTLDALLVDCEAPATIDLLSLDVEGAEIEVLKGINFSHFVFRAIVIESRSFEAIEAYLKQRQYLYIDQLTHHDYLFMHSDYARGSIA